MDSPESRTRYATDGLSGGEDTENREKLVDRGSNRAPRGGDCCGRSSVKNAWRDCPWPSLAYFFSSSRRRPLASPAPMPYGSILSVTWVGLAATLVPTMSIYLTLGRTSRSSACT